MDNGSEQPTNVRNWASELDDQTLRQAERTARLPILAGPVALMPDAHLGMGATVGSVIATDSAIIPAAVGVDIGCGMAAQATTLTAADLPDSLDPLLTSVERQVPAGLGKWNREPTKPATKWLQANPMRDPGIVRRPDRAAVQLGTLGGGNHFVEVCLDETDRVWVMLHSGSRGIGNQLAQHHIRKVKDHFDRHPLEDPDLAYFVQDTPEFDAYVADMLWAQDYAAANREAMMAGVVRQVSYAVFGEERPIAFKQPLINCHHNYSVRERHEGRDVWVTRKGAIRAGADDLGIIPGSMGQQSYIVQGRGSAASYCSASHGAGRVMSRTKARKSLGGDAFDAMGDTTWQRGAAKALVDEAPAAYKRIDQVMEDQKDLVTVVHELRAILNYKGVN